MKTVLRIEHGESRQGPYTGCCMNDYGTRDGKCPAPDFGYRDAEKFIGNPKFRYGCESARKLVRWFDKEDRQRLHEHGYVVRKYKVDKYEYQDHAQVIFDDHKAECVAVIPLKRNTSSPLV